METNLQGKEKKKKKKRKKNRQRKGREKKEKRWEEISLVNHKRSHYLHARSIAVGAKSSMAHDHMRRPRKATCNLWLYGAIQQLNRMGPLGGSRWHKAFDQGLPWLASMQGNQIGPPATRTVRGNTQDHPWLCKAPTTMKACRGSRAREKKNILRKKILFHPIWTIKKYLKK